MNDAFPPDDSVQPLPPDPLPAPAAAPVRRGFRGTRFSGRFLLISLAAHVIFGLVAAYLVVQNIQTRRANNFQSGPKGSSASRAVEHKVQMQRQKTAQSAPPQARRVVTTGLSKVSLPDMPVMPVSSTALSPVAMTGMGSTGFGTGGGSGGGSGAGGFGSGGGATSFGFHDAHDGLLEGTFYDLKQTPDRKPTEIATPESGPRTYSELLARFVKSGWNLATFSRFYQAKSHLYAGQIYVPVARSEEAPRAFGVQGQVAGDRWVIHYKGRVSAPKTGSFRFVGCGDNILVVRLNKRNIYDGSNTSLILDAAGRAEGGLGKCNVGKFALTAGPWFHANAAEPVDLEVIIGDNGGLFSAFLLIEEQGATYAKRRDVSEGLAYPLFQVVKMAIPHPGSGPENAINPEVAKEPMVFEGVKAVKSLFAH